MSAQGWWDRGEAQPPELFFGKYRAVVVSNQDPERRGRLRVQVAAVLGGATLNWALPCLPGAARGAGVLVLPPEGAQVWIDFEGGDPALPVWTGGFWEPSQAPAAAAGDQVIRFGEATLTLRGAPGKDALELQVGGGEPSKVVLSAKDVLVTRGGASLRLKADGIELSMGRASVQVSAAGITLAAGAARVELSAAGVVRINGGALEVT